MSFFAELKRRNVLRVGTAYVVSAWLITQVAETIFPLFGFDETPARIVVIVLAIGFVPVLIFAWVFELTPEGLKKEAEVDRSHSITSQTGRKLDRTIMVVLALGLAYFAFDKFVLSESREADIAEQARQEGRSEALVGSFGDKSIAVLAFDDMSPEGDQEYLSDGIAEELLNLLAKIPELRVISRSSAFSYKGKQIKLAQVAEELNVAHVLEGSVRKAGGRVRITVQLIEARSDTQLWSETYDRALDDVFAIQDDIAANVVDQLKVKLLAGPPKAREIDLRAYSLFLQARHLSNQGTRDSLAQARALYEEALAMEPDYAAGWNDLSVNYFRMDFLGFLPREEIRASARTAVDRALSLDPDYAPAHAHSAWLAMFHDNDMLASTRAMRRAVDLQPADPWIIDRAGAVFYMLGRIDRAIEMGEYVTAVDPLFLPGRFNQGLRLLAAGRWEDVVETYHIVLRLNPGMHGVHWGIGQALLHLGRFDEASEAFLLEEIEPYRVLGLALVQYAQGDDAASSRSLASVIEAHSEEWPSGIACVLAYRGETDRAFEWLDRAAESGDSALFEDIHSHLLNGIRSDPRWPGFLRSIRRAPEQLDSIVFEVTLPQ